MAERAQHSTAQPPPESNPLAAALEVGECGHSQGLEVREERSAADRSPSDPLDSFEPSEEVGFKGLEGGLAGNEAALSGASTAGREPASDSAAEFSGAAAAAADATADSAEGPEAGSASAGSALKPVAECPSAVAVEPEQDQTAGSGLMPTTAAPPQPVEPVLLSAVAAPLALDVPVAQDDPSITVKGSAEVDEPLVEDTSAVADSKSVLGLDPLTTAEAHAGAGTSVESPLPVVGLVEKGAVEEGFEDSEASLAGPVSDRVEAGAADAHDVFREGQGEEAYSEHEHLAVKGIAKDVDVDSASQDDSIVDPSGMRPLGLRSSEDPMIALAQRVAVSIGAD